MDAMDIGLSEQGKKEFENMIKNAAEKISVSFKNAMADECAEWVNWVDTDSWSNFRNQLRTAMEYDYSTIREEDHTWSKEVRALILKENRELLVCSLNRDNLDKIKELEDTINCMNRNRF